MKEWWRNHCFVWGVSFYSKLHVLLHLSRFAEPEMAAERIVGCGWFIGSCSGFVSIGGWVQHRSNNMNKKTQKRFSDLKKQGFCDQLVNIFPSSYATLLRFLCYVIPELLSNCINQGFIRSPHSEAIHSSDRMLQLCHLLQSHLGKQLWYDLRYGELLFNVSA